MSQISLQRFLHFILFCAIIFQWVSHSIIKAETTDSPSKTEEPRPTTTITTTPTPSTETTVLATTSPSITTTEATSVETQSGGKCPGGCIAGIVIGCLVGVVLVVLLVILLCRKYPDCCKRGTGRHAQTRMPLPNKRELSNIIRKVIKDSSPSTPTETPSGNQYDATNSQDPGQEASNREHVQHIYANTENHVEEEYVNGNDLNGPNECGYTNEYYNIRNMPTTCGPDNVTVTMPDASESPANSNEDYVNMPTDYMPNKGNTKASPAVKSKNKRNQNYQNIDLNDR